MRLQWIWPKHYWPQLATVLICIGLVALLISVGGAAHAATLEEIKQRGYMIVATEDDYPPFEFVKDGVPMGLDHDLFRLLQQGHGIPTQGDCRKRILTERHLHPRCRNQQVGAGAIASMVVQRDMMDRTPRLAINRYIHRHDRHDVG